MKISSHLTVLLLSVTILLPAIANAATVRKSANLPPRSAIVASIRPEELRDFEAQPKQVRALIQSALALTHLDLTYTFGGSSPGEGGMDCSGTISHVLKFQGLHDVPRQSDELCAWVRDHTSLHLTPTASALDDAEFSSLKPGDLVFWTGTYKTERKLPVTHVMLYLGRHAKSGNHLLFGSSDGRSYEGERLCGVSVFDFRTPSAGSESHVYGYGAVPGLLPARRDDAAPSLTDTSTKPPVSETPTTEASKEKESIRPAVVVHCPPQEKAEPSGSAKVSSKATAQRTVVPSHPAPQAKPRATTQPGPSRSNVNKTTASPAREALSEVTQALRVMGKSMRDAFQP